MVVAIDEDYFIPYTDNYGYVYDPETGTYIKQDPPEPTANTPSTTHAPVSIMENSTLQSSASVSDPVADINESTNKTIILLGCIVALLAFVFVLAREKHKK